MARVRAHFRDGSSELVASDAGSTPEEVAASITTPSLTGSAVPAADVPLESGTARPVADVDRFTIEDESP